MTYLFSNPEVKRWKRLFWISFFLNVVFVAALVTARYDRPVSSHEASPVSAGETAAPSVQPMAATPVIAGPSVGEKIPVWLTITDNFYKTFANDPVLARYAEHYEFPRLAEILSVQIGRLLMWDLLLRKEILQGDTLSFVFRMIPPEELKTREDMPDSLEVIAVSYFSQRLNKFIDLYSFRPARSAYPHFFYGDGRSLEKRLRNAPLRDHVQITGFRDDRTLQPVGVDFKTPTGTPVYATFDGRISRTNWQTRFNGYSVEIVSKNGVHAARYLHLSEVLVSPGHEVKTGDLIGKTGNTGKAPFPHLHYEVSTLGASARLLDPFAFHDAFYEYLQGEELKKLQDTVIDSRTLLKKVADR